ncbi:O-methyltransferase [Halalkalibacter akibai]|uniref:tRNA 5-hydroxyuridine methyltransferase n=1 Tax=Halalkalibacter akibai (strain ATCC 43226 / DSM 21942 / CIP 109018 / JCM 9157 / 1139) TaxID=1236973 RepID=W4QSJ6_HALA3|nr:O-methyltransferase [Halalkalibacter akibai]GAE35061.1 O-methyltransferase family protein [Halalkalibacter akibai JCM 9157]
MINKEVEKYLKSLVPSRGDEIEQIEEFAQVNEVPIMDLVGMESLLQLMKLHQPRRILEIGTAIGYSAIRMASALPETEILTIERDQDRYEEAIKNINKLNLANRIDVRFGDALELAEKLESEPLFDVLFIDAAKGQYQRFFDLYSKFVRSGGVIYSDNVLFRGLVAKEDIDNKRLKNLAKKIDGYNQWLIELEGFQTRVLPVGDGLAISLKQ